MGDRPSDAEQPSAKRGASRQLTKDDGSDGDDDEPVQMGSFQKASEDVMAKRRVIKARRPAGGAPASAPSNPAANPFAGIKLAAPAAADAKPAAEAPKKGGWDASFLANAQSSAAKATEAAAAEIEKSGGDKPAGGAPAASATPAVPSKWPAAFLQKAKEGSTAATEAAQAEIKKASGGGGGGGESDAPAAPPAAPKPTGGGWPSAFLAKAKEGSEAAKEAVAKEIEKEKGGGAASTSPPAAAPIFGGGGAGGFSFAATQANAFSFGGSTSAASGGGLSFGSTTTSTSEGGGFKFGSGGGFASFGAAGAGNGDGSAFPTLKSVFGDGSGGGTVQLGGTAPQPAVKLSEVEAKTGEEEEESVFTTEGALYEFDQSDEAGPGKWKERGKGKLSINVGKDGKARMVMRARGNLRLLLNAKLWPEMQPSRMDGGKGVSFTVVNAAAPAQDGGDAAKEKDGSSSSGAGAAKEGGGKDAAGGGEDAAMGTYALRLKGEGMMETFMEVIDKYKNPKDS